MLFQAFAMALTISWTWPIFYEDGFAQIRAYEGLT